MFKFLNKLNKNHTMEYAYQCPITANRYTFTKMNREDVIRVDRNGKDIDELVSPEVGNDEKKFKRVCRKYVSESVKPQYQGLKMG
ncbi:hypothetical protein MUN89_20325 [Halobacillus salinarum]|uniref:Uncharacterized protein n=1 Tax=Halobacillus salinarum TaxID=2932257 RepID=A0ABY4EJC8_9BACI|nr:hypothetical protein [Halobacillus salinarum]UOQ44173.1 hypothetical protein MUN89_20325 [Halobacillus salinarum]